jgi:hypothetical protein
VEPKTASTLNLADADSRLWSAMRYVLGEMPNSESQGFEEQLASSPPLCESLVTAMQICGGLAMVAETNLPGAGEKLPTGPGSGVTLEPCNPLTPGNPSAPSPRFVPDRSGARWQRFLPVSACIILLLAAVLSLRPSAGERADVLSENDEADVLLRLMAADEAAQSLEDATEFIGEDDSDADLAAPEWLLTAIELEAGGADERGETESGDNGKSGI